MMDLSTKIKDKNNVEEATYDICIKGKMGEYFCSGFAVNRRVIN